MSESLCPIHQTPFINNGGDLFCINCCSDDIKNPRPIMLIADWMKHFEAPIKAAGKQFDAGMEAASLLYMLDECGFEITRKSPVNQQ